VTRWSPGIGSGRQTLTGKSAASWRTLAQDRHDHLLLHGSCCVFWSDREYEPVGSCAVEGIGEDFRAPPTVPIFPSLRQAALRLADTKGFVAGRAELLRAEGVLGRSVRPATCWRRPCATAVRRRQPERVVRPGLRFRGAYLSCTVCNPTSWRRRAWSPSAPRHGARTSSSPVDRGHRHHVGPQDNLRPRVSHSWSLRPMSPIWPVVDPQGNVVGLVDETTCCAALLTVAEGANRFSHGRSKMDGGTRLETASRRMRRSPDLVPLFRRTTAPS